MRLDEFETLYKQCKKGETPVSGLCGRILRGKKTDDFITLTDEPETRKIIMLMASDGLNQLLGKSGYENLITIGYEKEYIEHKVNGGFQFKLVVFNEKAVKRAAWDNVMDVIISVYGKSIKSKLKKQLRALKNTSFDAIQKMKPYTLKEVDRIGESDKRFMTITRFQDSEGTLHDVRAFLYHTVHLRELFTGDGYTYDECGNRGLMEFIAKNQPLTDFGEYKLIDMTITLP